MPLASAFELRPQDGYLSVNWLEYWGEPDLGVALGLVRGEIAVQAKADGRFAVLNVAEAKAAIDRLTGRRSSITHQPTLEMESHAGIFGFSQSEREVAAELAMLVSLDDVHPGIVVAG